MLLRRIARPLLALTFVAEGVDALRHPDERAKTAEALLNSGRERLPADLAQRLPATAGATVNAIGVTQVAAGTLLAVGVAPRLAASALAAAVVPATLMNQDFWAEEDPQRRAAKQIGFLKDLGLLGGLVIAAADTSGKPSLGWRRRHPRSEVTVDFEPVLHRIDDVAEHARALTGTAAAKGVELAGAARHRAPALADAAKHRGAELADTAKHRGAELADTAKHRGAELADTARHRGTAYADTALHRGADVADSVRRRGRRWTR